MTPSNWSYSTGPYGARVRVYERTPGGPIQIEWSGGPRQSLKVLNGDPVYDRDLAEDLADQVQRQLKRRQTDDLRELLGAPKRRTLRQLLERYHRDVAGTWSDSHRSNQESLKRWWLERLGGSMELRQVTEARLEREVRRAGDRKGWSKRTRAKHLMYMRGAFGYARRKLKWIREEQDLTALDFPEAKRGGPDYSLEEVQELLEAAPEVDPRVDAALNLAWDTISRIRAIRHLRLEDLELEKRLVRFLAKWDKRDNDALVPISPATAWKLRQLVTDPRVQETGWLFPSPRSSSEPLGYEAFKVMLRDVEAAAGVDQVKRRLWHGIKRRAATEAEKRTGRRSAVSRQARTTEKVLERIYEQDDLEPKLEVVEALTDARTA